jgi:hypothetical protein
MTMNNHLMPEETTLVKENMGLQLLQAHGFWNSKRWLFNLLVGITGLAAILVFGKMNFFDLFGILAWGIIANGMYCFGYELESIVITRTKGVNNLQSFRQLLFWLGTASYMLVTLVSAYFYFVSMLLTNID